MSFSNLISSAIEQGLSGGSSGGGNNANYDPEFSSAHSHAQSHHSSYNQGGYGGYSDNQGSDSYPSQGGSSGGSDLFSTALSFLSSRKSQYEEQPDVDEEHMVQSHQALYNNQDEGQQHDSKSLGAGAAMQALKMFTSGSGGSSGDKNEFIGMAMAQASKLWDQKSGSGAVAGDKQSAINSAAEMAFKMYMKSQGSGSSGTGGPAGLMSLASKFL